MAHPLFRALLIGFLLLFCGLSSAESITKEMQNHTTATAQFLIGDEDKNPVLILHGFLQTHRFPTVSRLANALNESGYTVLTPTLTLGLNKRRKSIACEAIHMHNLTMDTLEISRWIDFVFKKTGKKVTLIGHSAGNQTLLNYLDQVGIEKVNKVIFISLSYFGEGPAANETQALAKKANAQLTAGFNPLSTYALSYCKTYPTTARDFLSYYHWNREKVISVAQKFTNLISIIIGSDDKRIDQDWRQQLSDNHLNIETIEGANHFFDQSHEFDLLDTIEQSLDNP